MIKNIWHVSLLLITAILFNGCGGTGGASGAKITLSSPAASTVKAGTSTSGSVTISATATNRALNDITVAIVTSDPNITGTATKSSLSGSAAYTLTAAATIPATKTVQVWAEYEGLKSNAIEVTLSAIADSSTFDLTVGSTSTYEYSTAAGTPAAFVNIVVNGNQVKFTGPNGEKSALPVTITIDRIDNWVSPDNVKINGVDFSGLVPAQSTIVTTNNTDGIALIPTIITVILPPAGATSGDSINHVYNIYWRASVTYQGLTYTKTGSTLVTGTTKTI